ncbi:MAG: thiol peroxidase [Bacteroidota bacterium]|nr:thiol peroxidase [Bacteroidota bacterium]
MSTIKFKGSPVHTIGSLPQSGSMAPAFSLTKTDLSESTLNDYKGKKVVLNIFPSLDTSVCAASVRHFNADSEKLPNTVILCISKDLPFAHSRFCASEGLKNVINLSEFKDFEFGKNYGVTMTDGPLAGLFSRAVIVLDEEGKVVYNEQVPEIAQEPDYAKALEALK